MRIPRDWSGEKLISLLQKVGYAPTRQTGSHVRLTSHGPKGDHHITIPKHGVLRVGTLNRILQDVARNLEISKDELIRRIR